MGEDLLFIYSFPSLHTQVRQQQYPRLRSIYVYIGNWIFRCWVVSRTPMLFNQGDLTRVSCFGHGMAAVLTHLPGIELKSPNRKRALFVGIFRSDVICFWEYLNIALLFLDSLTQTGITFPISNKRVAVVRPVHYSLKTLKLLKKYITTWMQSVLWLNRNRKDWKLWNKCW